MAITAPQPTQQIGATETYSENVLGPVSFKLWNLRVGGTAGLPEPPKHVAPGQSPYIITANEQFSISVDIEFNDTPLTRLLLCLGTNVCVDFCAEGCGKSASEVDLTACIVTKKDVFKYTLTFTGTPASAGLTDGFYGIAAIVKVGPSTHPCANYIFGCGYLAGVFLLVC
jgi:hypothetical protein